MQRVVTLANRSNMVMHKQITCLNKRVNASEKQLRDHINVYALPRPAGICDAILRMHSQWQFYFNTSS